MVQHALSSLRFEAFLIDNHLLIYDKFENVSELMNETGAMLFLILEQGHWELSGLLNEMLSHSPQLKLTENTLKPFLDEWCKRTWIKVNADGLFYLNDEPNNFSPIDVDKRGVKRTHNTSTNFSGTHNLVDSLVISLTAKNTIKVNFYESEQEPMCPQAIPRLLAVLQGVVDKKNSHAEHVIEFCVEQERVVIITQDYVHYIYDESYALSTLATEILRTSYLEHKILVSAHAACVGRGNKQILLPANSGSGKSTLTAMLHHYGWHYYGDDVVALKAHSKNTMQTLPFRTAIGLKPGSWQLVTPFFNELEASTITSYAGKQAKFLPVHCNDDDWQDACISAVVFPRYSSSESPKLSELSLQEAIAKFLISGVSFMDEANDKTLNLKTWLDWLASTPKYNLVFNDVEQAQILLQEVL